MSSPRRSPLQALGLPPQATANEIKHAYRTLVLKWHPDRHEQDKSKATKRFIEINEAYKYLTETLDLESNFEEPFVMNKSNTKSQSSSIDRQSSSRSSSELSDDSFGWGQRRSESFGSDFHTTPSSSFKESPTSSYFPQFPSNSKTTQHHHQPHNHRPERAPPASSSAAPRPTVHEIWRTGSDLPDRSQRQHTSSHSQPPRLSHPRPCTSSSIPKPPPTSSPYITIQGHRHTPAATSYCPPPPPPSSAIPRLSHSVVRPKANAKCLSHTGLSAPQRYQNHLGEFVETPVVHASPYDIPLASIGLGQSGEWTYVLPLTLEELFSGVHLKLPTTRRMLSGRTKTVTLELDIPAGCRSGSRLLCRRVGHEVERGVFQDIAFIIEDKPHDRFVRECDDLHVTLRIPLVEGLRQYGGEIPLAGVDGQGLSFHVDSLRHDGLAQGRSVIRGGGMPSRRKGKVTGRGDMIVNWEVVSPPPPRKAMGVFRRMWGK